MEIPLTNIDDMMLQEIFDALLIINISAVIDRRN